MAFRVGRARSLGRIRPAKQNLLLAAHFTTEIFVNVKLPEGQDPARRSEITGLFLFHGGSLVARSMLHDVARYARSHLNNHHHGGELKAYDGRQCHIPRGKAERAGAHKEEAHTSPNP